MNTPETPEINKMTQLVHTFSTACEKAAEGKTAARAAPLVAAALMALTVGSITSPTGGAWV